MALLLVFVLTLIAVVCAKYYTTQYLLRQQKILAEVTESLYETQGRFKMAESNLQLERRKEGEFDRTIKHLNREVDHIEEEIWKLDQAEKVERELARQRLEGRDEG